LGSFALMGNIVETRGDIQQAQYLHRALSKFLRNSGITDNKYSADIFICGENYGEGLFFNDIIINKAYVYRFSLFFSYF
jgi:hypothetical protein